MHELSDFTFPIRYRGDVVDDLLRFGASPRTDTQPRLVYQFLRALMTFEIRGCKARRRELEQFFGPQPLTDYAAEIEALRAKYYLLRRPPAEWLENCDLEPALADAEESEKSSAGGEQAHNHEQDEGRTNPAQGEAPPPDGPLPD